MSKTDLFLPCLASLLIGLFPSCTTPESGLEPKDQTESLRPVEDGISHEAIRIEVTEELATALEHGTLRADNPKVQDFMDRLGVIDVTRVFDEGEGAYRERRRRAGLHLWYDITLSPDSKPTSTRAILRAVDEAKEIDGIVYAEAIPVISLPSNSVIRSAEPAHSSLRSGTDASTIPNDPRFDDQWYLYNRGQEPGFVPGFDINVLDAWKEETGSNQVIVAVLDEGVQVDHPDLVDNIWTNPSPNPEMNDLHGYNFSKNQSEIDPGDHGTHVAGVIAASRNNGIGIAGVAGGDGTRGSGVKIMSCEIISDIANLRAAPNAFPYAADHGAVITNNSWGMGGGPDPDAIPKSYKVAIDYFIDNAGCDPVTGEQLPSSPMKGGVVIFSAGNDNKEYYYMPPAYKRVIAVGSNGPTGVRAIYSNHGDWVDISAPGGDYRFGNPTAFILSTIADDLYGYMQGTSMAAPLVTGVAALIASKFGGKGFTNEELMHRLLHSLRPYDIEEINPQYRGKLGAGYIDATKALAVDRHLPPQAIREVKVDEGYDSLTIHFPAVTDEDDGTALSYNLYYSEKPFSDASRMGGGKTVEIKAAKYKAGDEVVYTLKGLLLDHAYSLALVPVDRWDHEGQPVFFSARTRANHKPIVEGVQPIFLTDATPLTLRLNVTDPDGHDWTYRLSGDAEAAMCHRDGDALEITFRRLRGEGQYSLILVVSDGYEETMVLIPYEIAQNKSPLVVKEPSHIRLKGLGASVELDLRQYFSDPEGDAVSYEVKSYSPQLIGIDLSGSVLKLKGLVFGKAHLEVTAKDAKGAFVRVPLTVDIVPDEPAYRVYPIPCYDHIVVELSEDIYLAKIALISSAGQEVLQRYVTVRENSDRVVRIDTSHLAIGRYTLVITADSKTYSKPIVKN